MFFWIMLLAFVLTQVALFIRLKDRRGIDPNHLGAVKTMMKLVTLLYAIIFAYMAFNT